VRTRASRINRVGRILCRVLATLFNVPADLVHCPGCGSAKLAHHLCPHCYSSISRKWKSESKSGSASMTDIPS
jgi:ribosomal protein L32